MTLFDHREGDARTATSSSGSSDTYRPKRVSFKPTIRVREYLGRDSRDPTLGSFHGDGTADHGYKARIWYTEQEYDQIEASNTRVVKLIIEATMNSGAATSGGDEYDDHRANDGDMGGYSRNGTTHAALPTPEGERRIEEAVGDAVRGVEGLVPAWYDRMTRLRDRALWAVLDEQERQRRHLRTRRPGATTTTTAASIARASRHATAVCRREAAAAGRRDERFVRDEFGPLEPAGDLRYTAPRVSGRPCHRGW